MAVFLALNVVTIGYGLYQIFGLHPEALSNWRAAIWKAPDVNGSIFWMIALSLVYFPKLALGLSGFETGVVVMPLVKSDEPAPEAHFTRTSESGLSDDEARHLQGRIRNGKKLLSGAAIIMS